MRDGLGLLVGQPPILPGFPADNRRVLRIEQEPHNLIALIEWEPQPAFAEQCLRWLPSFFLLDEPGGGLIALDDGPHPAATQIEGRTRRQAQRLDRLLQVDVLAVAQPFEGAFPLAIV